MSARSAFLFRHHAYAEALAIPEIQGAGLARTSQNEAARLLRCGLMVQAYASLETFLRDRFAESMAYVQTGVVAFDRLPGTIQGMATFGALDGLRSRVALIGRDDPDALPLLLRETDAIASASRSPFGFSTVMFGYDRSNISPTQIVDLLKSIGVDSDPWFHLTNIAGRVGLGSLPLRDGLQGAYTQRNNAAHDAQHDIPSQVLSDFLRDSIAVALGFDAFVSRAARLLHEGNVAKLGEKYRLKMTDIRIRFLDPSPVGWLERREGRARAFRRHGGGAPDLAACVARAKVNEELVVRRDARLWPDEWRTPDCP